MALFLRLKYNLLINPSTRGQKGGGIKFWEAECFKIDPTNKKIHCRANVGTNLDGNSEFVVDYDYLVVAMGAKANTFNTPGVEEHCHFLKVKLEIFLSYVHEFFSF